MTDYFDSPITQYDKSFDSLFLNDLSKNRISLYMDTQTFLADLLRFVQYYMNLLKLVKIPTQGISRENMVTHDEKSLCQLPTICYLPQKMISTEVINQQLRNYIEKNKQS